MKWPYEWDSFGIIWESFQKIEFDLTSIRESERYLRRSSSSFSQNQISMAGSRSLSHMELLKSMMNEEIVEKLNLGVYQIIYRLLLKLLITSDSQKVQRAFSWVPC